MIPYLLVAIVPSVYSAFYFIHSVRHKRRSQAVSIGVLMLISLAVLSVLMWEYLAMP